MAKSNMSAVYSNVSKAYQEINRAVSKSSDTRYVEVRLIKIRDELYDLTRGLISHRKPSFFKRLFG